MFRPPHPQCSSREVGGLLSSSDAVTRLPGGAPHHSRQRECGLKAVAGELGLLLLERAKFKLSQGAAHLAWVGQTTEDKIAGLFVSGRVDWLGRTQSAHRPARGEVRAP